MSKISFKTPFGIVPENYEGPLSISTPIQSLNNADLLKMRTDNITACERNEVPEEQIQNNMDRITEIETVTHMVDDQWEAFFDSPDLAQGTVDEDGNILRSTTLSVETRTTGGILSGDDAVRYVGGVSKIGTDTIAYMWASGIILKLSPFTESEILSLNARLAKVQVDLGGKTGGDVFSGDDVYMVSHIVDAILEHVIDSNLVGWTPAKLRRQILVTDLPSLLAMALKTIYPGGYPISLVCNEPTGECKYTLSTTPMDQAEQVNAAYATDRLLDFMKTIQIKTSRLTPKALAHLADPNDRKKVDQHKAYRDEVILQDDTTYVLSNESDIEVRAHWRVPTVEEYITASSQWVSDIQAMVTEALEIRRGENDPETIALRNQKLEHYATTLTIAKSAAWYERIVVKAPDADPVTIKDAKAIGKILQRYASRQAFSTQTAAALTKFKARAAVAMTGIPSYSCPECGHEQGSGNEDHPTFIPLNLTAYFFVITAWRSATHVAQI